MKSYLFITAILFFSMTTKAQTTFIQTNIAKIAIHKTERRRGEIKNGTIALLSTEKKRGVLKSDPTVLGLQKT
jgi:hypothetical protein